MPPLHQHETLLDLWLRRNADYVTFDATTGPVSMQRNRRSKSFLSRVWLTPDLTMGFHQFSYGESQYDGLAHMHAEYSVVLCTSGTIEIIRGDRRDLIRAGDILIVNPGEMHRCRFGVDNEPSSGTTIIIRPQALRSVLEAMSFPPLSSRHIQFQGCFQNPDAFEIARKLVGEYEAQYRGFGAMAECLMRELLVYLLRNLPPERMRAVELELPPQLSWLHMHRATEYMNCHGKGTFRLSHLCSDIGVSPSRFIPLFKNSSGVSPHLYYNALLVLKARRLMQVERSSTKDAAHSLGFRNVSHFCAIFHNLTGVTPKADHRWTDNLLYPVSEPSVGALK